VNCSRKVAVGTVSSGLRGPRTRGQQGRGRTLEQGQLCSTGATLSEAHILLLSFRTNKYTSAQITKERN